MIAHPPDITVRVPVLYILSPDGDEECLYSGDSLAMRDERAEYLVIDGHLYYPVHEHGMDTIWEGRHVKHGRSVA